MPVNRTLLAVVVLVWAWSVAPASAQLRVVNYNVAQLMGDNAALADVITQLHADSKPGFAVPVSVFIFQEVRSQDLPVLKSIIDATAPPGVFYAQATFTAIGGENNFGGAQAMFYRAGFLLEDTAEHMDINTGAGRYTDRWRLRLLGYDSPLARFYVYSSHLKAGNTASDRLDRLAGVQAVRANSDALEAGTHIIYAGDFNFYNNTEPGYVFWFQSGNGQAVDPLGTTPWGGPGNAIKHTQSPRLIMAGGLIGGGMDDRFDFQLSTNPMHDGLGLSYIPGTYRSFGNDGLHHGQAINNGNNFYYPGNVPLSNFIADALHDGSDHIPVVVEYQIPARMNATVPANYGKVIQGATFGVSFSVTNPAPNVVTPLGADILDYTATGSGGLSGAVNGSLPPVSGPSTGSIPLDTSTVGTVAGSITFTSTSQAVQPASLVRNTTGTVVRPSNPSFSSSSAMQKLAIEWELDPNTGTHQLDVPVWNLGFDSLQALLNLNSISGVAAPFSYVSGLVNNIGASPATLTFAFNTTGLRDGIYEAPIVIHASDENLPGQTFTDLALTVTVLLGEVVPCPADLNNSGAVDVQDLLILLGAWGSCGKGDCPADLNDSGTVDVQDLLILLGSWGVCP